MGRPYGRGERYGFFYWTNPASNCFQGGVLSGKNAVGMTDTLASHFNGWI
jgi:hypothetical protein